MTPWSILLSPLVAAAAADGAVDGMEMQFTGDEFPALEASVDDIFSGLLALDEQMMSAASGGSETAIDIGNYGSNYAYSEGVVTDVDTVNSDTGNIANNVVSDNSGITTIFNNTGNGVVMQSTVNVNVFMDGNVPN
ncbi:MAG: hypothetical protein AAFW81_10575 [Pseudomonadota bacterium]